MGSVFFPAELSGGRPVDVQDPSGFTLHLTRADAPGMETLQPAGEVFLPPPGRWRVWLQGEWSMTPFSSLAVFPATDRWSGVRPRMLPVGPAGRVLPPEGELDTAGSDFWLLFAAADPGHEQAHELSRRRPFDRLDPAAGLLMPAGANIAGVWQRREERYTALSRPFRVEYGQMQEAPLETPEESESWWVVYLERSGGIAEGGSLADVELAVVQGTESVPPDETVLTAWGVYAFWYGLEPGPVRLSGGNASLYAESETVTLEPGRIHRHDMALLPRPSLTAHLVLPPEVRQSPLRLEVRKIPEEEPMVVQELGPQAGRHRFTQLVGGLLEVRLVTAFGSFPRQVELVPGEEYAMSLEPDLMEVEGQVRHGGEPARAEVRFQTIHGEMVAARTDEDGYYRVLSLQPFRWVDVEVAEAEHPAWRDLFSPSVSTSQTLDFDVPNAQIEVRVVDDLSGEGLAGAKVAVRNSFLVEVEPTETAAGGTTDRVLVHHYPADDQGAVLIPPPRPGDIQFLAFADGYAPLEEPVSFSASHGELPQTVEIRLRPYGDQVKVRLLLADGSPAQGAEVLRVDALPKGETRFSGRTDELGVVEMPADSRPGVVLVRHESAGAMVTAWDSQVPPRGELTWTLPSRSGVPLSLRVVDPSGQVPAAGAEIHLWLGRWPLTGRYLRWLLAASARTDAQGYWQTGELPPVAVTVQAVYPGTSTPVIEGLGDTIDYPWPGGVQVRAVQ